MLLERRLDNVVYRLRFASSRAAARQLVRHGHILVGERRVDVPSYLVRSGQTVAVREKSRERIKQQIEAAGAGELPRFLERTEDPPEGRVLGMPSRDDVVLPVREQLIVEFCSR